MLIINKIHSGPLCCHVVLLGLEIDVHERPLVRLARWRGKVVWVQVRRGWEGAGKAGVVLGFRCQELGGLSFRLRRSGFAATGCAGFGP